MKSTRKLKPFRIKSRKVKKMEKKMEKRRTRGKKTRRLRKKTIGGVLDTKSTFFKYLFYASSVAGVILFFICLCTPAGWALILFGGVLGMTLFDGFIISGISFIVSLILLAFCSKHREEYGGGGGGGGGGIEPLKTETIDESFKRANSYYTDATLKECIDKASRRIPIIIKVFKYLNKYMKIPTEFMNESFYQQIFTYEYLTTTKIPVEEANNTHTLLENELTGVLKGGFGQKGGLNNSTIMTLRRKFIGKSFNQIMLYFIPYLLTNEHLQLYIKSNSESINNSIQGIAQSMEEGKNEDNEIDVVITQVHKDELKCKMNEGADIKNIISMIENITMKQENAEAERVKEEEERVNEEEEMAAAVREVAARGRRAVTMTAEAMVAKKARGPFKTGNGIIVR